MENPVTASELAVLLSSLFDDNPKRIVRLTELTDRRQKCRIKLDNACGVNYHSGKEFVTKAVSLAEGLEMFDDCQFTTSEQHDADNQSVLSQPREYSQICA